MNLSNEQRAHDLTLVSLQIMYDQKKTSMMSIAKNEAKRGNDVTVDIGFEVYDEYQKIYKMLLQEINKDF